MTPQRYALIVGLLFVALGLTLGALIPVSVNGDVGSLSCGAPWTGGQPIVANELLYSHLLNAKPTDYSGLCSDARQTRGTIAIVLVLVGAVAVGGSFIRRTPATTAVTPQSVVPSD